MSGSVEMLRDPLGRALWINLIAALLLVTATACDPGEFVRVENRTSETVLVYESSDGGENEFVGEVPRGQTEAFTLIALLEGVIAYEVKDWSGALLGSKSFTWEEIDEAGGFTIVVR